LKALFQSYLLTGGLIFTLLTVDVTEMVERNDLIPMVLCFSGKEMSHNA